MFTLHIKTIPHAEQRYKTVGDWFFDRDGLQIRVSEMGNPKYEFLVALHELIEVILCGDRDITQGAVDGFDMRFEELRKEGNTDEPGDDPEAPYAAEHLFATGIEKLLASELGVKWKEYEEVINKL